jgi:hypothetical protein
MKESPEMNNRIFLGAACAWSLAVTLGGMPAHAQRADTAATKQEKPVKAKKSNSVCQGLAKAACDGNKECGWITPKKTVDKRGRTLKAYCQKIAGIAKKKPSAKKTTAQPAAAKEKASAKKAN